MIGQHPPLVIKYYLVGPTLFGDVKFVGIYVLAMNRRENAPSAMLILTGLRSSCNKDTRYSYVLTYQRYCK